ncbi:hypothetical protein, partial [Sansalvadorimonas verongulae]|uniref:hypothetical protein n=1 Tax=Sansalvadorimonas verongulae TaxID=2172824 RepID=UPI001E595A15
ILSHKKNKKDSNVAGDLSLISHIVMCALVPGEMTGCGESLITPVLVTGKGPVFCVDAFVLGEITGCGESPITSVLITDKGLVPCVSTFVGGEMS